jgi:hypothetical protein
MNRPLRACKSCGGYDDHPRHVLQLEPGGPVEMRHLDCCAAEGCTECQGTEVLTEGRRGQQLIDHLDKVRG